jgi:hypothetical protein
MTAIEIFKTIALVAGILIAPFIIVAAVCTIALVVGFIIAFPRFLFTIEVDDGGGVRECIGCHSYGNIEYCENCKIHKKAQKIIAKRKRREEKELADRQKRQAEDEEQIKYLQEYNRKKREGKK